MLWLEIMPQSARGFEQGVAHVGISVIIQKKKAKKIHFPSVVYNKEVSNICWPQSLSSASSHPPSRTSDQWPPALFCDSGVMYYTFMY